MAAGWGTPIGQSGEPGPDAASTAGDELAAEYARFMDLIGATRRVVDDPHPDPDQTEAEAARVRAAVTEWWSSTADERRKDL